MTYSYSLDVILLFMRLSQRCVGCLTGVGQTFSVRCEKEEPDLEAFFYS
jgi:hypothetical protein